MQCQNMMKNKWTAENKIKAGTVGAIEAVIKIINKHKDNDSVCEQGCEALCNMTDNNSKGL